MALYTESDDWQRFAREQMQNSAQNLQQKQAGLDAAKNQKTKTTLESALSGLFNGLKERGSDILNTVKNIEKTKYGWLNQIGANKSIENAQKDDSARRNEIAKKYGFNSYSEAINSDKVGDDFWNEIKANNEQTKQNLKAKTDAYRNNFTDVTKVNTNEAKGQALNTIDSVLGLLPGGAGVVANVAGGGISGVGDEYKAAGREGRDVDWSNAGKNALVGMASGTAGSIGGSAVGKVAGKLGGSTVGKLVGSNVAKGTIGGAASGAVGGAVGTALNGGTLEDALLAAKEGAKAGAIGGGTMASVMGLGGTALDKVRNRGTTAQAIEPIDAEIVQKNRIEAPTAERIPSTVEAVEPVSNRRGIAITDLDAGEQAINVRNANKQASRGKYIDGVVRGKNLPEAEAPKGKTFADLGEGANLAEAMNNRNSMFGNEDGYQYMQYMLENSPELRERVKVATRDYANEFDNPYAAYGQYGISRQSDLPALDREQYYDYISGQLKKNGGKLSAEDIPSYMQNHLRENDGNPWHNRYNDKILNEIFGDDMSLQDQYALYDEIAQVRPNPKYTTDNMAKALYMDDDLRTAVENQLVSDTFPTNPARKINIESALAQAQPVDITDLATNYRKSTIPARQYDQQTIKAMPEAEITTPKTVATAETATAEPQRQVAVDPSTQAKLERDIYVAKQRQGQALLDQYGTLERPYRRMVGGDPAGVLNTLYDDYGLKTPAEVQFAANHVTGKDGTVSKMTRKLAASAQNVPTAISEDFVNELLIDNGLNEAEMKSIKSQIQAVMNRTGENGYSDGATTLQAIKNLEGKIRDIKGESGTYHNMSYEDKCRASALQAVRDELTDRLWANADIKNVMTEDNLNTLRNMYKDNPTWQDFVNNKLANAKDGAELRALMKPLVNGAHIVEGSNMTAGSAAEKVIGAAAKGGSAKGATKNILSTVVDITLNSDKAKQKRAENYANQAKQAEAQLYGEAPVNTNTGKLGAIASKAGNIAQGAKSIASGAADLANRATASLNNDSLAGINGIRTRNGNTIEFNALGNQAQQFANKQMGKAEAERSQNRLENAQAVANAQADYDNALADYNAQEANYNANMATIQNQATGASQLDRIAAAMEMALNAGDITAYGQLADLYTQAAKIEELRNPTSNKTEKALSANQAKALTAQQQLEALAQMSPDAGTVASGIPLLGNIVNLTGGNEYANQASSLATTLGYLLSGANIKESEAQRIGQAYVPTAFDSEAVRKQKLERARQLIQSYMADTGALEA